MSKLSPVQTIAPQEWMLDTRTQYVMRTLCQKSVQSLFVGGCVRNAILGVEVQDIDIATQFLPEQVMEICEVAGMKCVPTGIDHGTVTVVYESKSFEVTTLRHDLETDGRHARVGFTDDWLEDAERRDFTMNTLLMDGEGQVFDPLKRGLEDLKAGRVVFVGDAEQRIEEDYLRILRFFRFFAHYGRGEPDETALKACAKHAKSMDSLSRERITQEMFKLLSAKNPGETLSVMFAQGVLERIAFLDDFKPLGVLCELQNKLCKYSLPARLYALMGTKKEHLKDVAELVILPKAIERGILDIDRALIGLNALPGEEKRPELNEDSLKVLIYRYGKDAVSQVVLLYAAEGVYGAAYVPQAIEIIDQWDVPVFPISGDDLKAKGFEPGPALGRELKRLEEEWISSGFKA